MPELVLEGKHLRSRDDSERTSEAKDEVSFFARRLSKPVRASAGVQGRIRDSPGSDNEECGLQVGGGQVVEKERGVRRGSCGQEEEERTKVSAQPRSTARVRA